jgi:hypothetical protein
MPYSPTNHGTALVYGSDGAASPSALLIVNSSDEGEEFGNNDTMQDENGETITHRQSDPRKTITLNCTLVDGAGTLPVAGGTFGYRSIEYIIESVSKAYDQKGFAKFSMRGIAYIANAFPSAPSP